MDLMARIASDLKRAKAGSVLPVDERHIHDVLPPYWREDATDSETAEEWFIRLCRGFGLHATYDGFQRKFKVQITRDAEHEASITWPGHQRL